MADDPVPAAIPWYKSQQFQAVLTLIFSQILAHVTASVQKKYDFDVTALGITPGDLVEWTLNAISAGAGYWALHVRATQKNVPKIVPTQTKADVINQEAKK